MKDEPLPVFISLDDATLTMYYKKYKGAEGMKKKIKKAKKARKITHKGPTLMDRLPKNHGEWLSLCIKFTERAIDQGGGPYLVDQLWRLQVQLEEWKKENPDESKDQKTAS